MGTAALTEVAMLKWWRERGNAARFDLYVRGSFYLNYATVPVLLGLGLAGDVGAPVAWVILVLAAGFGVVCVQLIRGGIAHYLGRADRPARLIAITTALATAGVVAGYLVFPHPTADEIDGPGDGIALFTLMMYVTALATAVRPRTTAIVWAVASVALALKAPHIGGAIAFALLAAFLAATFRLTLWMLGMVWELDRARQLESKFAVAEERLRFARDLHDVVGRNLSVVALKSELAAQLAKRGRAEAVDEMLEVRRIAQDSLAELRAVVGGYREADLAAELGGARSLLSSAGIDCRVVGDVGDLPREVQGALGWVVREGTTNVLRHSEARTCTITLRPQDGVMVLTMDNDGATGGEQERSGSGLVGLSERIAAFGGSVTAERRPPDGFRLTATLPEVHS